MRFTLLNVPLFVVALVAMLLWSSCSDDEEDDNKKKAKTPTKSTATGKTNGIDIDDDGLTCPEAGDFRMIWGFPATATTGRIDLSLFEDEDYHFTATWYNGEHYDANGAPQADNDNKLKTEKIVGDDDVDAVLEFDLSALDATADSTNADGNTLDGGFGGDGYNEVTVIIKGKASKLYLCNGANAGEGMQSNSNSAGNPVLLKVVMSPLCWGGGGDSTISTTYKHMFNGCADLKEVGGKIDDGMTSFQQLFEGLTMLETVDVSAWDTSNVENMRAMFKNTGTDTNKPTPDFDIVGVEKLDFSSLNDTQGMRDMFTGSKLRVESYKNLLFGLLTKSPSADPHLEAGNSKCDDGNGGNKATDDTDENCCIRAQYKLHKDSEFTLTSGDDLTAAPYNLAAFPAGYGACTLPSPSSP
ncbi:MAG: BspA family leucine-rich repeat surface protein [Pseudomonadota bacterium]|nr:BspA family leucine-rich repeat surface protein [Pseudomonadota bacterium]